VVVRNSDTLAIFAEGRQYGSSLIYKSPRPGEKEKKEGKKEKGKGKLPIGGERTSATRLVGTDFEHQIAIELPLEMARNYQRIQQGGQCSQQREGKRREKGGIPRGCWWGR